VKTAAALALLLLLTACAATDPGAAPSATPHETSPDRTSPHQMSPREIVAAPDARLVDVRLTRTGDGVRVQAWWQHGRARAVAVSDDGFATARYRRWTSDRHDPTVEERAARDGAAVPGLLPWRAGSLSPRVQAVVGGGDGATLFPFQQAARSTDGGATWTTYDVPKVDGARAYTSGQVVLADGRLLVLLNQWSDDRNGHPSSRPHGFYVSAGDDWSHYTSIMPTFLPALTPAPRGWSPLTSLVTSASNGGVVWTMTYDGLVYASTDGARTFREIRVR
jgi:hypothetical protein